MSVSALYLGSLSHALASAPSCCYSNQPLLVDVQSRSSLSFSQLLHSCCLALYTLLHAKKDLSWSTSVKTLQSRSRCSDQAFHLAPSVSPHALQVTHMIWVVRAGMLLTNATILVDLQFDFLPCVTWAVSSIVVTFVATILTKIRNAEGNDTGIVCRSEVPPLGVKTDFVEINSLFHTDHENRGVGLDTQDNTQLPNRYGGNESVSLPDMQCGPNSQHTNQTACEQNPFPLYTSTGIETNTDAGDIELNDLFVDKGDDVVRTTCNAKKGQH